MVCSILLNVQIPINFVVYFIQFCLHVLQWKHRLRNLSGDSCNSSGGGGGTTSLTTPRYQLAEHRYGREEMLILFDRNCKPPEPLTNFSPLYVEKTQLPLALIQMTEDETVNNRV